MYSIFEHRHRFATWAATRAVQRGWGLATVKNLKKALEKCGVVEIVKDEAQWPSTAESFDALHHKWCCRIMTCLEETGLQQVCYGLAAKLIALYLKAMIVIVHPESMFATVAHPPIDSILLQNLAKSESLGCEHQAGWRRIKWTQLGKEQYFELIKQFRECGLDKPRFWHLENYWTATK